jgi:quercetin dioxygenase-like cupin family protein
MASYIYFTLNFVALLFLLHLPSHSSTDPSPLQDFCFANLNSFQYVNGYPCKNPSQVTSEDFFYAGLQEEAKDFSIFGVNVTQGSVKEFAGLNTLGISTNRITFLPGGLNPPHTHPRASELALVTAGKLLAGWVTTGDTLFYKVVTPWELFVIPPGLIHFQLNVGKGKAVFYAAFNSQNPGIQIVPTALFNSTPPIPGEVLMKAFKVNETIIDHIMCKIRG